MARGLSYYPFNSHLFFAIIPLITSNEPVYDATDCTWVDCDDHMVNLSLRRNMINASHFFSQAYKEWYTTVIYHAFK